MIVRPAAEQDAPGFIALARQVEHWFGPKWQASKDWSPNGRLSAVAATHGAAPAGR